MIKYLYFLILMIIPLHFFAQQKTGIASFYHAKFSGKKTASGDIFSNQKMTGASNHFRLGEWVKVTNVHNGKIVYVLINDRMAKNSARLIDLTQVAAKSLDFMHKGLCQVTVERCTKPENMLETITDAPQDTAFVAP